MSVSAQFHFDAATYDAVIRAEVVGYDVIQGAVADATLGPGVKRILDLGAGTGETSRRVLERHPQSQLVLLDENPDMLAIATRALPSARIEAVIVGDLRGALPTGPFDLVISCLAIHHLLTPEKGELFHRISRCLGLGARFVLGDVVIPDDPREARIPLSPGYDHPSRVSELLGLLTFAQLVPSVSWRRADLAVIRAAPSQLTGDERTLEVRP